MKRWRKEEIKAPELPLLLPSHTLDPMTSNDIARRGLHISAGQDAASDQAGISSSSPRSSPPTAPFLPSIIPCLHCSLPVLYST